MLSRDLVNFPTESTAEICFAVNNPVLLIPSISALFSAPCCAAAAALPVVTDLLNASILCSSFFNPASAADELMSIFIFALTSAMKYHQIHYIISQRDFWVAHP